MPGPWRRLTLLKRSIHVPVSISTEMPGSWRLGSHHQASRSLLRFNLNRDARPLATRRQLQRVLLKICFNLNRDARPLATEEEIAAYEGAQLFQSQPRCQAPHYSGTSNLIHSPQQKTLHAVLDLDVTL